MFRIGMIEYINAMPFYYNFDKKPSFEFCFGYPSKVNQFLAQRNVHSALVSISEFTDHEYPYWIPYGISCESHVESVLFFSKRPLDSLEGATIAVTSHSSTSVRLLKILCKLYWKQNVHFTVTDHHMDHYDGFLLIGDRALKLNKVPHFEKYDLAFQWHQVTGLPFVFAAFAQNPHLSHPYSAKHADAIIKNLNENLTHTDAMIANCRRFTDIDKDRLEHYFSLLSYSLGAREKEAIYTFSRLWNVYQNQTS